MLLGGCENNNDISRKCHNNRPQLTQATEKLCYSVVEETIMKYPESTTIIDRNLPNLPRSGVTWGF